MGEFNPAAVCVGNVAETDALRAEIAQGIKVFSEERGLEQLVNETEFDVLLNALVGAVGLRATVAALKRKKRVALANKESLVIGGEYINRLLESGNGELVPVDSEHSAILQCMCGEKKADIESLILTASGGPFRDMSPEKRRTITPEQALNHPTWSMGPKISIDSATLINKGFEVIEAHYLFGIPYKKIRVLIHPQSIIHSMVEYHDGAVIAQMGVPDMELPIQLALSFPDRLPMHGKRLDLAKIASLTFFDPDFDRFPCLRLCLQAAEEGGTAPAVVNAANEIAVKLFLNGTIGFDHIAGVLEQALSDHPAIAVEDLETIETIDKAVRTNILKKFG
jgi:1-deoxy-D-xylulose-5-phosphate reductoisomerase